MIKLLYLQIKRLINKSCNESGICSHICIKTIMQKSSYIVIMLHFKLKNTNKGKILIFPFNIELDHYPKTNILIILKIRWVHE